MSEQEHHKINAFRSISCLCDPFYYRQAHEGSGRARECKGRHCECNCHD